MHCRGLKNLLRTFWHRWRLPQDSGLIPMFQLLCSLSVLFSRIPMWEVQSWGVVCAWMAFGSGAGLMQFARWIAFVVQAYQKKQDYREGRADIAAIA